MQEKVPKTPALAPKTGHLEHPPTNDTASLLSDFFGMLFAIGLAGALTRRNAILVLVGIELMLKRRRT